MKRALIFLIVLTICIFTNSPSFSLDKKDSNYQIVNDISAMEKENKNYNVKNETDNLLFIEKNEKLGIIDKTSQAFILEPVADEIIPFEANNETEYKLKINNNKGYLNTNKKIIFIGNYDDLSIVDNYIKVKKDNKFGLFSKEGNSILKPIFDEVGVINNNDTVYLTGKYNKEVKLFDKNGKYISENEFYTIKDNNETILVRDLKPIIKKYRKNNGTVYRTAHNKIDNSQIAFVEKNIEKPISKPSEKTILKIKNKNYILINDNGRIGLNKENGDIIIPAAYNSIDAIKPCKHFFSPVIAAKKQNYYSIYDLKGKLLAENVYNKFNIYKYGKVYSYKFEDGKWILRENNKIIGSITINNDGSYEFTKTRFYLKSLHKINELLITLLSFD